MFWKKNRNEKEKKNNKLDFTLIISGQILEKNKQKTRILHGESLKRKFSLNVISVILFLY